MMSCISPEIIVSIDLGTTYTGVAWARPQKNVALQSPVQVLHNWPGGSTRNEQKVRTCLVYSHDSLSSWGFLCEEDDGVGKRSREFFKIFLDKKTLESAHRQGIGEAPSSVLEAKRLVSDYLRQIYEHVKVTIELHTGIDRIGWKNLAIEFIFSVPTTWKSQGIINIFKEAIHSAGFGTEGGSHYATVELTESEAAAVATIKSSTVDFTSGDIFLCIDAGGGTTDFAAMQVVEARRPFPSLKQINQVDGIGIGSVLIDQAFISMVNSRLAQFPELVASLPPECAEALAKSERFRTMKHKFGERVYESGTYKLPLDGVSYNFNHPEARIELGRLILTREEVRSLFEPQVQGILQKLQEQLSWTQMNGLSKPVSYIILSGGLGSSAYVRDRLQHGMLLLDYPHAHQIKILQAPDPQLVVTKGLLLDRLQKLDSELTPVIVSRVARHSYGVVCKSKYDPNLHFGQVVQKDPYDGQLYAMEQVEWMIKKGDAVQPDVPITSTFTKKVDATDATRTWDAVICISDGDRNPLPTNIHEKGVQQLCVVHNDLTGVKNSELTKKRKERRLCFIKGKKYYVCKFEVKAIVGPADLTFELWFGGKRFSGNHAPIKITWDDKGAKVGGS